MADNSSLMYINHNELYRSKFFSFSKSNEKISMLKDVEDGKEQIPQITFGARLGLGDFLSAKVWRASLMELMATAIVTFLNSSIAISTLEAKIGGATTLIMSILMGTTLALLVFATLPISGGHLNPVISMSAGLMGLISLSRALIYIMAQCVGGVLGALSLRVILSSALESKYSLGGCTISTVVVGPNGSVTMGLEVHQAFYLELICCFIYLFALRWVAFDQQQAKSLGQVVVCSTLGIIVGLNIFISNTVTGVRGYSGAGLSPARCLGPAIVKGGTLWDGHWIFWVAPALASFIFYTYTRILSNEHLLLKRIYMILAIY